VNPACITAPATYLSWYDNASPGMVADNIHILNTGTTTSSGCVIVGSISGQINRMSAPSVSWTAGAGQETYVTLPPGTYGGPVRIVVASGPPVLASQRIQFYKSFKELSAASTAQEITTGYFNWYDRASPGMLNDNIHLYNPGSMNASVTITVPRATAQTVTVAPDTEAYVSFPQGTMGGPVTVNSSQPVLASQRVQFNQSFNEMWAESSAQATVKSYFNWYDSVSPGVAYDNIHLLNPGATAANVTFSVPGGVPATVTVAPGAEAYLTEPPGSLNAHCAATNCAPVMGGPATVSSDQPVLASQRVQFNSSFSEIWSAVASQAATTSYFNWYDKASPGMYNDNVHLTNPGTVDATVTVSLPGGSQTVTVVAGNTSYVTFPGQIGGPVTVSSNQPVLASQRVQYYQSFSETWSG
jgi:hypothetical protein